MTDEMEEGDTDQQLRPEELAAVDRAREFAAEVVAPNAASGNASAGIHVRRSRRREKRVFALYW